MNVHSQEIFGLLQTKSKGTHMKSQIVLITGATSGIGRHAALTLAARGHRVFATGRRKEALQTLEKEAAGLTLETISMDVTKPASIEEAKRVILERTDGYGVDALLNNAGYGKMGPLEEVSHEALVAQYETNVFGLMAVTRAFVPAMRERGFGRVVNVSSIGGRVTFPMMGAYNSTKYAVESLSDALRLELRPFGVEVSIVEPGAIKTEFADVAMGSIEVRPGSPYTAAAAKADAMKKAFEVTEVGPAVVSRAIQHAIESRSPRPRYVAPFSAAAAVWFMQLFPTRWVDAILGRVSGLTRKNLLGNKPIRSLSAASEA